MSGSFILATIIVVVLLLAIGFIFSGIRQSESYNFSLKVGNHYRINRTLGALRRDQVVVYLGSHQETCDRSYVTYHDFMDHDGHTSTLAPDTTPGSLRASFRFFTDIEHPDFKKWDNKKLMVALNHRHPAFRSKAADSVSVKSDGLPEIVKELYKETIGLTSRESAFHTALKRTRVVSLPIVEKLDDEIDTAKELLSQHLLAYLGSQKYVSRYLEMLRSDDQQTIRFAIKKLQVIGDSNHLEAIRSLENHSNFNVRDDVKTAIGALNGNQGKPG